MFSRQTNGKNKNQDEPQELNGAFTIECSQDTQIAKFWFNTFD